MPSATLAPEIDLAWADAPLDWMVTDEAQALRPVTDAVIHHAAGLARRRSSPQPAVAGSHVARTVEGGGRRTFLRADLVEGGARRRPAGMHGNGSSAATQAGFARADIILVPSASHAAGCHRGSMARSGTSYAAQMAPRHDPARGRRRTSSWQQEGGGMTARTLSASMPPPPPPGGRWSWRDRCAVRTARRRLCCMPGTPEPCRRRR